MLSGRRDEERALIMQSVAMTNIIELRGQPCRTPAAAQKANDSPIRPLTKWRLLVYNAWIAIIMCMGNPITSSTIHINALAIDGNAAAKSKSIRQGPDEGLKANRAACVSISTTFRSILRPGINPRCFQYVHLIMISFKAAPRHLANSFASEFAPDSGLVSRASNMPSSGQPLGSNHK